MFPGHDSWVSPSGALFWVKTQALRHPTLAHIAEYRMYPEVVRMLIDRYGSGRFRGAKGFVRDVVRGNTGRGAWLPHMVDREDGVGTLWSVALHWDNPLHVVEVIDSAAMKGGRHKHHWLRVPHTTRTARGAVAWTFRLHPDQYYPAKET